SIFTFTTRTRVTDSYHYRPNGSTHLNACCVLCALSTSSGPSPPTTPRQPPVAPPSGRSHLPATKRPSHQAQSLRQPPSPPHPNGETHQLTLEAPAPTRDPDTPCRQRPRSQTG